MAVWEGLLFGMILQLSVGPVCMAVLHCSIRAGFRAALWMTLGVALADALYMLAAIAGLSVLLQIPPVKTVVVYGGVAILVWFGIGHLRSVVKPAMQSDRGEPRHVERTGASLFPYGMLLTLTNPLSILFWTGVFGSLAAGQSTADSLFFAAFACGCVLSTVLFLGTVAALGNSLSRFVTPLWIKRLDMLVGIVLIGFAIFLLQNGVNQGMEVSPSVETG